MFIFFTELVKRDVVDRRGMYVGRPHDLIANLEDTYPRVTHLVVSKGSFKKRFYVVPWKDLHLTNQCFQLKVPEKGLVACDSYAGAGEHTLRRDVLDEQVVDTFNRKVVRVNDLHFLRVDDDLRLAHVDIGMRGLVRRLGWEKSVDFVVRLFYRHSRYLNDEALVSWKYVQPLSIEESAGKIKLAVEVDELKDIPPSDVSTMLVELDPYHRAALLRSLDVQSQVDIITELDLKLQEDIIESLDAQSVVTLLERMPSDEATDLLSAMQKKESARFLSMLSTKKAREISDLMQHESDSAGGLMTKEFITLQSGMTVGSAIDHIKKVELTKAETIHTAYVLDDEGRLEGAVSFRRLLLEPLDSKIADVMMEKPPSVNVSESVKDVAYEMDKYNLSVLPAVDDEGKLEGIITIDDVLHIAVEEAWGKKSGL